LGKFIFATNFLISPGRLLRAFYGDFWDFIRSFPGPLLTRIYLTYIADEKISWCSKTGISPDGLSRPIQQIDYYSVILMERKS